MARPRLAAAAALALLLGAAPLAAQSPALAEQANTIDDASWLAGRWVGTGLGGEIEEVWSPPAGGQMIGTFALRREGRPIFYELMMIDRADQGIRLRVKHFNPDFTGWEERGASHAFAPRSAAPGDLRFDGLRYQREGEAMTATVRIQQRGASRPEEVVFRFRRAPL